MTDVSDVVPETWDPLHAPRDTTGTWSTSNIGEALPGVPTPLGWSIWAASAQRSTLGGFYAIGALSRRERVLPEDPDRQFLWAFYGRGAVIVERLAAFADRLPGTSGPALAEQMLGRCPPHITAHRTYRRYPIVAVKLPWTFATVARRVRQARARTQSWYTDTIGGVGDLDLRAATALLADAHRRFEENVTVQGISLFGAIQPLYEQITSLARTAGVDGTAVMGGYGSHAETEIVTDLWETGRGRLEFNELVLRHGYHGPMEGEVSSRVWREEPQKLRGILAEYAALPEDRNPAQAARDLVTRRRGLEADLVARLPRRHRPRGRAVLAAARTYIPLRGTAKVAFLQSIDVARASARRVGALLYESGAFADPEDAFYLTVEEIVAGAGDVRDLIARRRERRALFQRYDVPTSWEGFPTPQLIARTAEVDSAAGRDRSPISGIGVSAGIAEGPVRVIHDPDFGEITEGEILVAPTTDPSWAAVLYLSKALVVDIGGALSHAAIVARELGIPCVVNTGHGSVRLRDGDRVRVDGTAGTVEFLGSVEAT